MVHELRSYLSPVAVAALLAVLIRAFYRAFESRWPENYFGGEGGIDPVISRTPWRYAIFRMLPVAAGLSVAGTVSSRLGYSRPLAVILAAALHAGSGPLVGLMHAWRRHKVGLAIYRCGTIVGCGVIAVGVVALGAHVDTYIPTGHDVAAAIWTGLAVLALAQLARSLTGRT